MRIPAAGILVIIASTGLAEVDGAQPADIAAEKPTVDAMARPIKRIEPRYPRIAQTRGQEGWVLVSFVVQPDGSVSDPVVDDSNGISSFETEALRTVKKWTYEPAMQDGKAVQQCQTKTYLTFEMEGSHGARRSFIKFHREAGDLINSGSIDAATELIDEKEATGQLNLYENARLWLLRSEIAGRQGNRRAQLAALRRGTTGLGNHIEKGLYKKLLPVELRLELGQFEYSAALNTYETMKKHPDLLEDNPDLVAMVEQLVNEVASQKALYLEGEIADCPDCKGNWSYKLLRREFTFETIAGQLNNFELRCDWKYFNDNPNKEVTWRVPANWGACHVYLYGEPGTKFKFLEYPDQAELQSNNLPATNMGLRAAE